MLLYSPLCDWGFEERVRILVGIKVCCSPTWPRWGRPCLRKLHPPEFRCRNEIMPRTLRTRGDWKPRSWKKKREKQDKSRNSTQKINGQFCLLFWIFNSQSGSFNFQSLSFVYLFENRTANQRASFSSNSRFKTKHEICFVLFWGFRVFWLAVRILKK